MLTDRVLRALDLPDPEERRGTPLRGSRLGACARQSAYMLHGYPPAPLPARAKLVFRFGDMIHEMVRREFRRVLPGEWGMEEQRFHFPVPLTVEQTKEVLAKQRHGLLPKLTVTTASPEGHGLTLDTAGCVLWIPLHVDGIADLGEPYGLATVEIKSMATGSFRRALQGHVDYSYRVQMAAALEATGLSTQVLVSVRKDTSHLLEVIYSKVAQQVAIRFTKQSLVSETMRLPVDPATVDSGDWEAAEVAHPFEPPLLVQARARVISVLMSTQQDLPAREYGPDFVCRKCQGAGRRTCRSCRGTGLTRVKRNPCGPCQGEGRTLCEPCAGQGLVAETALPWQCSYCPHVARCYGGLYRLEITDRPEYLVNRALFTEAGIVVRSPESPVAPPAGEEEEPEAIEDVAE